MSAEYKPFDWGKTFVIGFGFLGVSLIWALYNSYVPVFLKDSFELSSLAVGAIMTGNNLLNTILLPYFGAMSDRTRGALGRRRPYLLVGTPISILFFVMIPMASMAHHFSWMILTLVGVNLAMTLYRAPVVALMPDVTPSVYRSQANGVINLMGGLGALLAFFGGKILYDRSPMLPFVAAGAFSLLSSALVILFVKESPLAVDAPLERSNAFRQLLALLREVMVGEKSLLFVLVANLLWTIGFSAVSTFLTSYTKYYLEMPESTGAMILGLFALAFMIVAIGAGFLGTRYGRKRMILIGLVVLSAVLIAVLGFKELFPLSVLFMAGGVAWALVIVNALPMVIDMAPSENVGGYTGLYYFASQAGTIVAPVVAGALIDLFGYASLMVFCSGAFILGALCMLKVRRGEALLAPS